MTYSTVVSPTETDHGHTLFPWDEPNQSAIVTGPAKAGLNRTSNFVALKTYNSLCGQAIGVQS